MPALLGCHLDGKRFPSRKEHFLSSRARPGATGTREGWRTVAYFDLSPRPWFPIPHLKSPPVDAEAPMSEFVVLFRPFHRATVLRMTSVIANNFSSSSLRPTSCRLTGMPCTELAESSSVSVWTRQAFKYGSLTIFLNLPVHITQCLMVGIWCINSLIGRYTTGERNSRIIKQVEDTCIPGVSEIAILDTAVWRRRSYRNRLIKNATSVKQADLPRSASMPASFHRSR